MKGATPYGQGSKAGKKEVAAEAPKAASKKGERCHEPEPKSLEKRHLSTVHVS